MAEIARRYRVIVEEVDEVGNVLPCAEKVWVWMTITDVGWKAYQDGNRDAVRAAFAGSFDDAVEKLEKARNAQA